MFNREQFKELCSRMHARTDALPLLTESGRSWSDLTHQTAALVIAPCTRRLRAWAAR
jgi:hypothetical protein